MLARTRYASRRLRTAQARQVETRLELFLYDLGVLDHRNTTAIRHLAF
jgi:hypothetical protein